MPELAIEIRGAEKRYPGFALGPLDLALEKGYVLGLIGPNGAGKTTTLRLLMGLAAPDAGEIRVLGGDPRRAGKGLRSRIGFVYDESRWYGRLSAGENAAWASRLYDNWDDIGFRRRLGTFGVAADKALDELSKGQRMKFALAVALSHGAELVVMDEPTGGLDPVSRSELLDALREAVAGSATSILFSTHITTDLERMADYVAFMKGGRLVFCEELDEVLERYALVKGPAGALEAGLAPFLVGRRVYEGGFEGLTDRAGELMARGQGRLLVERASLEDIMIYSVREDYNVRAGV
jgi:ABC-2 type transport system ATP-binding protein